MSVQIGVQHNNEGVLPPPRSPDFQATMRILSAIAVIAVSSYSAFGASTPAVVVAELEPNSTKATATVVACLSAGDAITGTSSGASALPGDATVLSADVFRIRTCALPAGVYRHRLTLTTSGAVG